MIKTQIIHIGLKLLRILKLLSFACVLFICAAFLEKSRIPTTLEKIQAAGKIVMLSRNGPTTYYVGPNGYTGFEYILASAFANQLGVTLEVAEEENLGTIINRVGTEAGDFAAAGLSVTKQRKDKVAFSPPYLSVTQKLIYQAGNKRPRKIEDLYGKKLVVIANSSHEENLRYLKLEHPELDWEVRYDIEMMELLELVHFGEIDYTIVDSNAYEINHALYPRARMAFDISEPEALAWVFPKQIDTSLIRQAELFFAKEKTQKLIKDTLERFYGHIGELDYGGAIVFTSRLESRLPKWRDQLQAAADETGVDWQLLAALSYQESHWNPRAVSPTGVKGFMMLTLTTAKEMGVKNRLKADQSIIGGARYFRRIFDRIPERIPTADRTWLALAAYNVGFGHLEDARVLTEHFGGNPDKWTDVRENLLLLSKRKYYKSTKHGYARGWEAVEYVQNIRNFYNIIAWHEKNIEQQVAQNTVEPNYEDFSPIVAEAVRSLSTPSVEL